MDRERARTLAKRTFPAEVVHSSTGVTTYEQQTLRPNWWKDRDPLHTEYWLGVSSKQQSMLKAGKTRGEADTRGQLSRNSTYKVTGSNTRIMHGSQQIWFNRFEREPQLLSLPPPVQLAKGIIVRGC